MREQLSIYYHQQLPESRTLKGYAESLGIPIKAIDICKVPFTPTQWLVISQRLNVHVSEFVHMDRLKKVSKKMDALTSEDWAILLAKEPWLLRKPIAQRKERLAILNTASDLLQL